MSTLRTPELVSNVFTKKFEMQIKGTKLWKDCNLDDDLGVQLECESGLGGHSKYKLFATTKPKSYFDYYGRKQTREPHKFYFATLEYTPIPHCCGSGLLHNAYILEASSDSDKLTVAADLLFQFVENQARVRFHRTQLNYYVVNNIQQIIEKLLIKRRYKLVDKFINKNTGNEIHLYTKYPKAASLEPTKSIKLMKRDEEEE